MESDHRPPRNVFFLSADSLNQRGFASAASDLAALVDGVEFTRAMATASDTNSAVPGLAAGVYSDSVPGWGLPTEGGPTTMAEALSAAGYECGLWSDNYLFGEQYGYGAGFSGGNRGKPTWKKRVAGAFREGPLEPFFSAVEWAYFAVFTRAVSAVSDDETLYKPASQLHGEALEWLETAGETPVCCWIHYMDTHHPYEPPQEYLNSTSLSEDWDRAKLGRLSRQTIKENGHGHSRSDIADVRAAYDACCAYLRDEVIEFVETIAERGHFDPDRDVLIFTADHGECLDPRQYAMMGHVPPAFWEDVVRVPLVVSHPQWDCGTYTEQVSLIDLMPTVLRAAGVDVPESVEGRACDRPEELRRDEALFVTQWGEEERGAMRTFRGIRGADGAKVFGANLEGSDTEIAATFDGEGDEILYRGRSLADDLSTDHRAIELLSTLRTERGPLLDDGTVVDESNEELETHLRNLGYIE